MEGIFFYIFSAIAILCAIMVVANPFSKNPVTSALFLVLTIISLAGLFVLLNAYFIAAVQILIYAGAVIVLFLFVLMLVDLKEEEKRRVKTVTIISGLISAFALLYVIIAKAIATSAPATAGKTVFEGSPAALGNALFSQGEFLLPFEAISLLLLVAIVGAVFLGIRENRQ